jgi:hypothetical protein
MCIFVVFALIIILSIINKKKEVPFNLSNGNISILKLGSQPTRTPNALTKS